jgi:hypothetical protein
MEAMLSPRGAIDNRHTFGIDGKFPRQPQCAPFNVQDVVQVVVVPRLHFLQTATH